MTTGFHRETAKIYQFPVGGRSTSSKFGNADVIKAFEPAPSLHIDFGSWYHDEAIRDAEKDGKPHA
jgi:hypothetical protein